MDETTNENINGIGFNEEQNLENNIDNAFSDLISEFFEGDNASNINAGPVLDWDSVADGQLTQNATGIELNAEIDETDVKDSALFSNLEAIYQNETTNSETQNIETTVKTSEIYKNIDINNEGEETNLQGNGIYNELGKINTEGIVKNAIGAVTATGEVINNLENTEGTNNLTNNTNTTNVTGSEFKLTQGNLPAKIGFWTKVRNFFIPDSKLQYSVEQSTGTTTGVWNKLQNLFSFGKNK